MADEPELCDRAVLLFLLLLGTESTGIDLEIVVVDLAVADREAAHLPTDQSQWEKQDHWAVEEEETCGPHMRQHCFLLPPWVHERDHRQWCQLLLWCEEEWD